VASHVATLSVLALALVLAIASFIVGIVSDGIDAELIALDSYDAEQTKSLRSRYTNEALRGWVIPGLVLLTVIVILFSGMVRSARRGWRQLRGNRAEQGGADQPATASESTSEGVRDLNQNRRGAPGSGLQASFCRRMNPADIVVYNGVKTTHDYADSHESAQTATHYRKGSDFLPRVPFGAETYPMITSGSSPCPCCDAAPGFLHEPLCEREQCPYCNQQVMPYHGRCRNTS